MTSKRYISCFYEKISVMKSCFPRPEKSRTLAGVNWTHYLASPPSSFIPRNSGVGSVVALTIIEIMSSLVACTHEKISKYKEVLNSEQQR